MLKYVVIFSIGPVQTFIASARRSRDLWSGSWLLSELAKACAKSLNDLGDTKAQLIFPHVDKSNQADLEENSDFSVGNKVQAVLTVDSVDELKNIIDNAKKSVKKRFIKEASNALSRLPKDKHYLRETIWNSQLDDYLEIQTAWARFGDDNSYHDAAQKAGQTLASRKATRDFSPTRTISEKDFITSLVQLDDARKTTDKNHNVIKQPYQDLFMLPKSSLDGMRETVLKESGLQKNSLQRKLSLSKSEQLDTVGVIKRLGFEKKAEQFTPFTRITAHAWIKEIAQKEPDALNRLKNTYHELCRLGVASGVTGNNKVYQDFAYDAQLLYPSRLEVTLKEYQNSDDKEAKEIVDNLKVLKKTLAPLFQSYGEPYRYGVLLLADGDRMGELLDKAKTQVQHQEITQALSNFAGQVAYTMRQSSGHCIYAGGDDVLGFVPLDKAYKCADDLQKLFANSLSGVANKLGAENSPTLSVGLAICHIMTPLGVIRELASQAEKFAKGDHVDESQSTEKRRNALGILLSVRSGNDTKLRFNWDDLAGLNAFETMVNYYVEKQIPSRIAYDVREIYLRTCDFAIDDKQLQKDIQSAELLRMLKQARTNQSKKIADQTIDTLNELAKKIGLDNLANELIVARWFAAKTQKDLGKE
ncbi:MAG: type III-B CRISPR-associated protein Cas10/Cmr2 [Moraxella sp.]